MLRGLTWSTVRGVEDPGLGLLAVFLLDVGKVDMKALEY
jgi:hypothetical protein